MSALPLFFFAVVDLLLAALLWWVEPDKESRQFMAGFVIGMILAMSLSIFGQALYEAAR